MSVNLAVYASKIGLKTLIVDLDPQRTAVLWSKERGNNDPTVHAIDAGQLRELIRRLRQTPGLVDLCLLDTAPSADKGLVEAIGHADLIICPSLPGLGPKGAMADTLDHVEAAGMLDRVIGVPARLPTSATFKALSDATIGLEQRRVRVSAHHVCERASYHQAFDKGMGVTELRPADKKASTEIAKLFGELMETWPVAIVETVG